MNPPTSELQAAIERVKSYLTTTQLRPDTNDLELILSAATQSLALQQTDKSEVLEQLEALAESLDEQGRLTSRNIVHGAISHILALQQANAQLLKDKERLDWLVEKADSDFVMNRLPDYPQSAREAIDAAMSKQVKGEV